MRSESKAAWKGIKIIARKRFSMQLRHRIHIHNLNRKKLYTLFNAIGTNLRKANRIVRSTLNLYHLANSNRNSEIF